MSSKFLYDTFNARYLTFEEIGSSFIPNKQFDELIKNNHSLLMGPRGSGKTTMLKMLTPLALESWKGSEKAKTIREKIPFYSVYIPTDIQWKREIEQVEKEVASLEGFGITISKEIVNVNIIISLCKTFFDLITTKLNKEEFLVKEVELSKELVDVWKLEKPITPNLLSIQQFFLSRIKSINKLVNKAKNSKSFDNKDYPDYFFEGYYDPINEGMLSFEKVFKDHPAFSKRPFRWALCFDELEIAPKWLQDELLGHLRSREQRIVYKLTTSPIISLSEEIQKFEAQKDNDYKIIRIWVSNNSEMKEWNKFCGRLIAQRIKRKLSDSITPDLLFGTSDEERSFKDVFPNASKVANDGQKYSYAWHLYRDLALNDLSFKKYLTLKGIDPENPIIENSKLADEVTRKIKQIAIFRYTLIKPDGTGRSRKAIPLYYGITDLCEISDGNPRIIIGLIDQLLSLSNNDAKGVIKTIPINAQAKIIRQVSKEFWELISAHPDANVITGSNQLNLGKLIKNIADYFYNKLIKDDFKADPVNTFIIDYKVNTKIHQLFQLGLELGAIVYLDPSEGISDKGLLNKNFRLSYMLTPFFNLPKREYGHISLSTILNSENARNSSIQGKLF